MTYLAGSVASLVTDRNTWHSRADSAWGASRVWNSGSSFETDSATWHSRSDQAWGASRVWGSGSSFEQDSATWHSRADQAWGTSRAWNSGESWEAAYNRVLPYAGPYDASLACPNCPDNNNVLVLVAQTTVPMSGYYALTFRGNYTGFASNAQGTWSMRVNGGQVDSGNCASCPSGTTIGQYWQGYIAAGGTVQWYAGRASQGYGSNVTGTLHIVFIPTPSYPH
jgi:uncharacterized lipoprotein NlpE involved in copper resistance